MENDTISANTMAYNRNQRLIHVKRKRMEMLPLQRQDIDVDARKAVGWLRIVEMVGSENT